MILSSLDISPLLSSDTDDEETLSPEDDAVEPDDLSSDDPHPDIDAVTIVNAAIAASVFFKFFIINSSCLMGLFILSETHFICVSLTIPTQLS